MRRLSLSRLVFTVLPLLVGAMWLGGCSTEPVNVEGCRSIEDTRCEVAGFCPNYPNFDVEGCKRFYHDQCLHGLSSTDDPGEPNIERCVAAIRKAGECARKQVSEPCNVGLETVASPCDMIEHPENYVACSFLVPPAPAAEDAGAEAAEAGEDATAEATVEAGAD